MIIARVVAVLAIALAPHVAVGQAVCRPSSGSAEAQLLSYYAVPLAFSSALPTPALARGEVAIALEMTYVPAPASNSQRSDECFVEKSQHTELSPVLPRPRVAVGLPGGVVAEFSYLPPVTVADATPSLLGLALSLRSARESGAGGGRTCPCNRWPCERRNHLHPIIAAERSRAAVLWHRAVR